jgi:hypothetical protein
MPSASRKKTLYDAYRFPGFTAARQVKGYFGDSKALVIRLNRRSKKRPAASAGPFIAPGTIAASGTCATSPAGTGAFTWLWISAALTAGNAGL